MADDAARQGTATRPDLSVRQTLHLVGIGGSGMSPIARVLVAMGHRVSGSDQRDSAVVAELRGLGVEVTVGHHPSAASRADAVGASTAVPADDQDLIAAAAAGIPVLRRSDLLAGIAATRRTLAVAGTHGKTSTTALLAYLLRATGCDPSWIVGGQVPALGGSAGWGGGEWLVVEADESDGTFLELGAEAAIVTNVELDHVRYHWGSFDRLVAAFETFLAAVPGPRVVCIDDPVAAELAGRIAAAHAVTTCGTDLGADYVIDGVEGRGDGVRFRLSHLDRVLGFVDVPQPGLHTARNATAALVAAMELGVAFDQGAAALADFGGVARRFEHRGVAGGVTFIDDYAHLPSEVRAALQAARSGDWHRVVAVFQPHRYTRTAEVWADFADAFVDADAVAITDVYSAGEPPIEGVSGKLLVDAVLDAHPHQTVAWLPTLADVTVWLTGLLRPGDLCLGLGAGDVTDLPDLVRPLLVARSNR